MTRQEATGSVQEADVHESPLLEFDGVTLTRGDKVIAEDVSFRLHPGEILVVSGPSGLGKTTLLHTAAGLLTPAIGTVRRRIARQGMVFQEPRLLPWLSVHRNVRLGAPGRGVWSRTPSAAVEHALDKVGLAGTATMPPYRLSGGMQRRAALARALYGNPSMVFADEPFAHLDSAAAQLAAGALARAARAGAGVMTTAHEVGDGFPLMGNYRTLFL
ncbi:ATP-binding cassette domain-containing protein [Rhodococcus sp. HNM0569]|uniref:ATP-binding cassette domain-containing protein n=1 Tax=Rhodococcus sp. HNM0569 TaxID=2716340 RepID=UPI00146CBC3B|nr:ATP-binding cassette domain-containing protein [Rhodococcus sp. HNM0569]NLU84823.1 ABC transporter ATP-binding protein [Rhodococcus sp. HNM0569]